MSVISNIFRHLVGKPLMEVRGGKPIATFNKLQFWVYPELCRVQMHEALSHCDERSRVFQMAWAKAHFGPSILLVREATTR
ncbi:hypothetical protein F6X40_23710 [Paraburkholderia sp. UCT31]|uniref:hypothetical protein n=1 Tax=Paraburkholderia sp. UCT31 TaxID=2615209 RepID=UPI00165506D9|nr:hypothetical protein [Paraburkholderia sp. UCT31]MBC8739723.1 hypothetical protein [Paraburkholderia sp. UCT31]